jgi:hypothetical protein
MQRYTLRGVIEPSFLLNDLPETVINVFPKHAQKMHKGVHNRAERQYAKPQTCKLSIVAKNLHTILPCLQ